MLPADIRVGWVFRYAYLWNWQPKEGREEGDKVRPSLVLAIVATETDGTQSARVLPITHSPPTDPASAVELPAGVKSKLGLDDDRSWVILTESNRFAWPGPDLRHIDRPGGYYGPLPAILFNEIKRRFVAIARGEIEVAAHASVSRTE